MGGFEVLLEAVERVLPEAFVEGEPVLCCLEAVGVEADDTGGAATIAADERGTLEDVEVLGDGGEGDGVGLGDLADGLLAAGDVAEDGAAGLVGEGVEDSVECGWGGFNHVVECSAEEFDCQPFG